LGNSLASFFLSFFFRGRPRRTLAALATTGFGFALEIGVGAHAGGVQRSSSGKLSTEKHTPG